VTFRVDPVGKPRMILGTAGRLSLLLLEEHRPASPVLNKESPGRATGALGSTRISGSN